MDIKTGPVRENVVMKAFFLAKNHCQYVIPSFKCINDADTRTKDMFEGSMLVICETKPRRKEPTNKNEVERKREILA